MASDYYKPCKALEQCNALIANEFAAGDYAACFQGHLALAETGYPLAECQVGYFYLQGLGVPKDLARAVYWTKRAAVHGDRDAQYNLGEFYEHGTGVQPDMAQAAHWYRLAAKAGSREALQRCQTLPQA